jgi:hypothetical protein
LITSMHISFDLHLKVFFMYKNMSENPACIILLIGKKISDLRQSVGQMASVCVYIYIYIYILFFSVL